MGSMKNVCIGLFTIGLSELLLAQGTPGPGTLRAMPYADAKPVIESLRTEALPNAFAGLPLERVEQLWPAWLSREDQSIRLRVEGGDEDSIINLLLFGTTFTARPRATERELAALATEPSRAADSFAGRVDDLISGLTTIRGNDRLDFVRGLVARKGIDVTTVNGRSQLRRYLHDNLARVATEVAIYDRAIESAAVAADPGVEFVERATLFRNRGLSSDTSLFTDFAIEEAVRTIQKRGAVPQGGIQRVGIVGPGLDFVDKHEGFDFYPQQTIQPFAVIDSLLRLELARPGKLQIVTFDVSPRINQHLEGARRQAQNGYGYTVQLPREPSAAWHPNLESYWTQLGDQIGDVAIPVAAPLNAATVESRAVKIRPSIVLAIAPRTLNIVTERLNVLSSGVPFDVIIATNVLVYYDAFEQSLALVNIAAMLRPGGLLVANGRLLVLPSIPLDPAGQLDVIYTYRSDTGEVGDRISWFRRRTS
jgi:hypothetical protein